MPSLRLALVLGSWLLFAGSAHAASTAFFLDGNAGLGLLPGNENPAVVGPPTPGSGGILTSIVYDDATNILTIDIGWGSGNGFTDLSGVAVVGHLHGPTTDPGPSGGFSQNASPVYDLHTLVGWNPSASAGGFNGTVSILEADEAALLAGRFYANVHTAANSGGEIRGHLVAVPEPSTAALLALGIGLVAARRRAD